MNPANPFPNKQSIALIGFRGSGKTIVGRALAELIGQTHVDTDELIMEQERKSIAEIFHAHGQAGFRERERGVIVKVAEIPKAVISVGGGAVLDEGNVRRLRTVATVIWLTAPPETLWRRISEDPTSAESRPSLTNLEGLDEVEHLLAERRPYYERAADYTIETVGAPEETASAIARRLGHVSSP